MLNESPQTARATSVGRRLAGSLGKIAAVWSAIRRPAQRDTKVHARRTEAQHGSCTRRDSGIPESGVTPVTPDCPDPIRLQPAALLANDHASEPVDLVEHAPSTALAPAESISEHQGGDSPRVPETIDEPAVTPHQTVQSAIQEPEVPAPVVSPALAMTAAPDPALENLRQQINRMEERVLDLEAKKAGMEALIDEHAFRQYQALGDLLHEQLVLRHQMLNLRAGRSQSDDDLAAAAAAAEELAGYETAARGTPPAEVELEAGDENELRTLYRSAAMRCHPDRVDDADKDHAHDLFLRTQDAYRRRDLDALRLIARQLETDRKLARSDADRDSFERLQTLLSALEDKGVDLAMSIHELQGQPRFRQARQRERWEDNFAELRSQIESECMDLRREIARFA